MSADRELVLTPEQRASEATIRALLRCGTEEELRKDPDNYLRLTIGLRREGGRWVVAHEHHSFPARD